MINEWFGLESVHSVLIHWFCQPECSLVPDIQFQIYKGLPYFFFVMQSHAGAIILSHTGSYLRSLIRKDDFTLYQTQITNLYPFNERQNQTCQCFKISSFLEISAGLEADLCKEPVEKCRT